MSLLSLEKLLKTFSGMFSHNDVSFPSFDDDDFRLYLPKYLSPEEQNKLLEEIRYFTQVTSERPFYSASLKSKPNLFQGDIVSDVIMARYEDRTYREVKGMLISNTCDASDDNPRMYDLSLTFAPIIDLSKYEQGLKRVHDAVKVDNHIKAIRNQELTTFFYLPAGFGFSERVVVFDKLFSLPRTLCEREKMTASRISCLSNFGFYLLLFKLSYHFSRIQERVNRG